MTSVKRIEPKSPEQIAKGLSDREIELVVELHNRRGLCVEHTFGGLEAVAYDILVYEDVVWDSVIGDKIRFGLTDVGWAVAAYIMKHDWMIPRL